MLRENDIVITAHHVAQAIVFYQFYDFPQNFNSAEMKALIDILMTKTKFYLSQCNASKLYLINLSPPHA
jgi:hypothetical protein